MKETELIASDEAIKELWDLRQKLKIHKKFELKKQTYEEFYKEMKKPIKALVGNSQNE